jgi:hypothetical protein
MTYQGVIDMKQKSIRFPQTYQLRPALGLNAGKLPLNLTEQNFEVGGLKLRLLPASTVPTRNRPHRLLVTCNVCGKEVSAGRFNQHQAIHPRELLSQFSLDFLRSY